MVKAEKSYPAKKGELTRAPSTRTRVCVELVPRRKTEVREPSLPWRPTSSPGTERSSSSTVVAPESSIFRRVITVVADPRTDSSSGERVAVTETDSETGGGCCAGAGEAMRRRGRARARRAKKRNADRKRGAWRMSGTAVIRTSRSTRRKSRAVRKRSRAREDSRARSFRYPDRERSCGQVSWLPDLPPSGSFPDAQPILDPTRPVVSCPGRPR